MRHLAGASAALALAVAPASASPAEVFGFGSRQAAQAGAGVAAVDDFAATLMNPAGLARNRGKRLTLGGQGAYANLKINDRRTGLSDPAGAVFGLTAPAPLGGPLADRIQVGLGMYVLPGGIARIVARFPDEPFYPYYQGRTERLVIVPGAGVRVLDGLEVGRRGQLPRRAGRLAAGRRRRHPRARGPRRREGARRRPHHRRRDLGADPGAAPGRGVPPALRGAVRHPRRGRGRRRAHQPRSAGVGAVLAVAGRARPGVDHLDGHGQRRPHLRPVVELSRPVRRGEERAAAGGPARRRAADGAVERRLRRPRSAPRPR